MIVGIGIDMVEVERIRSAVANKHFCDKVYTANEQDYCKRRGQGAAQSYAARFAGKEAILKALGTGFRGGSFLDMEIFHDELGAPQVILSGHVAETAKEKGVTKIHLSLTHLKEYAAAECIMEATE